MRPIQLAFVIFVRHVRKIVEKAIISCASVSVEQLSSQSRDFHDFFIFGNFSKKKTVEKIQVSLKSVKNKRYYVKNNIYF